MSVSAMSWAWRQDVSATAKLVLIALADHANDEEYRCWPSLTHLANKCRLDRSTVIRCLDSLEQGGQIVRTQREGNQTTTYTLSLGAESNQVHKATSRTAHPPRCIKRPRVGAESDTESSIEPSLTGKRKSAFAEDPRRAPFLEFVFTSYSERFGELITDQACFAALKILLAKSKATLEELQSRWLAFLDSTNPFHRSQGKPLRFFCQNINAFAAKRMEVQQHGRESEAQAKQRRTQENARRLFALVDDEAGGGVSTGGEHGDAGHVPPGPRGLAAEQTGGGISTGGSRMQVFPDSRGDTRV